MFLQKTKQIKNLQDKVTKLENSKPGTASLNFVTTLSSLCQSFLPANPTDLVLPRIKK